MEIWNRCTKLFASASPELRRRLIAIFLVLFLLNCGVWIITFLTIPKYPLLLGLVTLAYSFGLRHAVDADHIAAIDNCTRKLLHDGKKPIAVGFFFSLGHSTIVVLLSMMVVFSAAFVKQNLPIFEQAGSIIGTSVSSLFL